MKKFKSLRIPMPRSVNPRPHLIGSWFHYLRISPSYCLAKKFNEGTLTAAEMTELPVDFDKVLATYEDFGDVWAQPFSEWWQERWRDLFEANVATPRIRTLAYLQEGEHEESDIIHKNLEKYLSSERPKTGFPATFIYAIPVNATKKRILEEISYALDIYKKNKNLTKNPKFVPKPKYSLEISKMRESALATCHRLITVKAQRPNWKLWQLADYLKICQFHTEKIVNAEKLKNEAIGANQKIDKSKNATYEKQVVNATVSRHIRHAFLLSENAARGKFPVLDEIMDRTENNTKSHFYYDYIREQLQKTA